MKNDSAYEGLLRFDLGSVPPGATINQATLRVYAYNRDRNAAMDVEVYRALREWVDSQANWDKAALGNSWGAAGANDTATDRGAEAVAVRNAAALNAWYEFDVSEAVKAWVADPRANRGMILRGYGTLSLVYHFASANHSTIAYRPQLVVDYTAPANGVTPTPTRTATRTRTPSPTAVVAATATATRTAMRTATPASTATPTRTPTSTATVVPTSTATASLTRSATLTVGPSPTSTKTPTLFPGGHNVVTLQQGVLGYQGTTDTYITAFTPGGNFVLQGNLVVKNDSAYEGLLRFDLGSIPPGAVINQATLRLYAYNRDKNASMDVEVYRLLREWVDSQANWDRAALGNAWGAAGANDTATDRRAEPVAVQNVSAMNAWYEFDVTELVKPWVADPRVNRGMILRGFGTLSLVYHFASANHSTVAYRPQFVVDFTAP